MAQIEELMVPTVHLNGSDPERLIAACLDASRALSEALDKMLAFDVHARDFYVQGEGAFSKARIQNEARFAAVGKVRADLLEIAEKIQEQVDARTTR